MKVVENFVKFQTVEFKDGIVATGWQYADSNATEPNRQWCYYRRQNGQDNGFKPTLFLDEDADMEAIGMVGLTYAEYLEAQRKCQWFNAINPQSARAPSKTY